MNVLFGIALFLAIILITSSAVYADSKIINSIDKALKKYSDKKGEKDLCTVFSTKKSDSVGKQVWSNDKCNVIPEPPKNKPPVITVDSPIKCVTGLDCSMTSKITDSDGNITSVEWTQKQGSNVNLTISSDGWVATFTPIMNETLIFNVKATDNNGSSSNKDITVVVGSIVEPCPTGTHRENGQCVPDPQPSNNVTKIALVGDIGGSTVTNAIKNAKVDYALILGDYYQSSASGVTSILNNIKTIAPQVQCLLGNHESANEDGNAQVEQAALQICGDHWSFKINNVGFIGFDSNNLGSSIDIPKNVSSMVVLSHKQCLDAHPNNHHPVESSVKAFCESILSKIPSNVKVYWISGHDHTQSENKAGDIFTSGAGGRSHYTCSASTDPNWWCQNQKYGYLLMSIDNNDGSIDFKFIDTNGNVIH